MKSALNNAYTIKIENFEGPFDLLFHLIEKNKLDIYEISISDITDQYMEYIVAMRKLDLEITSEFLVMASTLLHIKSKLLLPKQKGEMTQENDEIDSKEELIVRLIEYKKYKGFSEKLQQREKYWGRSFYKSPEIINFKWNYPRLELSPQKLMQVYCDILEINMKKTNNNKEKMSKILQAEKVTVKQKIREIVKNLINRTFFVFSDTFNLQKKSKLEIVTTFMAMLELSKENKVNIVQKNLFSDIIVYKAKEVQESDLKKYSEDDELGNETNEVYN